MISSCTFSKKNGPIMPLDQSQQWIVLGASTFQCMCATILLVYIPAKIKMSFIWKDDFFLPKSASFVSRSQAHLAKRCWSSDSFWLRRLFNVCVRVFCTPNATILLVYIPAKIKLSCSSCSAEDKINYLSNQTWGKYYHSRNKHWLKKNKNIRWRILYKSWKQWDT